MLQPPRNGISFRHLAGFTAFLALLMAIAVKVTWYPIPRSSVVGTYVRPSSVLLPMSGLPDTVVLYDDGTLIFSEATSGVLFKGPWHWDEQERVVRTEVHRWDRQLSMRSTLFGPRLAMRICTTPFNEDLEERDDEVDLRRIGPPIPGFPHMPSP